MSDNLIELIHGFMGLCRDFKIKKIDQDKFVEVLLLISKKETLCKAYPEISYVVYTLSEDIFLDLKDFFGINNEKSLLDGLRGTNKKLLELDEKSTDNLNHFERHIRLSFHQRNYMDDKVSLLDNKVSLLDDKITLIKERLEIISDISDKIESKTKKTEKKINTIEDKSSGMYSEFVGILGVFTALSFALMGSVQVFGNIFDKVQKASLGTIGNVLVAGGVYLILIYLIIMTLFVGMKKIVSVRKNDMYTFNKGFTSVIVFVSVSLIFLGILFVAI